MTEYTIMHCAVPDMRPQGDTEVISMKPGARHVYLLRVLAPDYTAGMLVHMRMNAIFLNIHMYLLSGYRLSCHEKNYRSLP